MKNFVQYVLVLFYICSVCVAQTIADYYPVHEGNYWIYQSDSTGGEYNPSTMIVRVDGTNLINGEEYFRISHYQEFENGTRSTQWYIWLREDSAGGVIGAYGTFDSVIVYEEPVLSFPFGVVSTGFEWQYEMQISADQTQYWNCRTESISAAVDTPYGTYENCLKTKSVVIDDAGDTIQVYFHYYALDVGPVQNKAFSNYSGEYNYKLTECYINYEYIDEIEVIPANGFIMPFNQSDAEITLQFTVKNITNKNLSLNLKAESTDSTYLLYCVEPDTNNFCGNIWRMRPDGSEKTRITSDTLDFEPQWSPDGSKIVFHSLRSGVYDIWIMNADGTNLVNLTNSQSADRFANWSPDGNHIIFSSDRDYPESEVYIMNSDGSDIKRLTYNEIRDDRASYAPDGLHFITQTKQGSDRDILVYISDGTNCVNIGKSGENYEYQASFTPDSRRVVWCCGNPNESMMDIVSANLDGTDFRIEYSTPEDDYIPRYSPDGQLLTFSKSTFYPSGGDEIFIWNKALDKLIQVTDNTPIIKEWGAAWSPFLNSPDWVVLDNKELDLQAGMSETISVKLVLTSLAAKDQTASILINKGNRFLASLPINLIAAVSVEARNKIPDDYNLSQNYPNPFNPATTIEYSIPALTPPLSLRERVSEGRVRVTINIYDILGNEITTLVNREQTPGTYEVEFDGSELASGLYIYQLNYGGNSIARKMVLLK